MPVREHADDHALAELRVLDALAGDQARYRHRRGIKRNPRQLSHHASASSLRFCS